MANMSFVSLINILLSSVEEEKEKKASQEDIDKFFGQDDAYEVQCNNTKL